MKKRFLLFLMLWLSLLGSTWAQNNALHFSYATQNRVDIGDFDESLPDFSQGFSFAGWVKFDEFKDLARVFTFAPSQDEGSDNLMLCASGTTGLLMAEVDVAKVTTTTALQTNKWYFLSLTVTSGGVTTIYVDGVVAASKTLTAPANLDRNTCYLGNSSYRESKGLNGSLDEVSIWSRALSAADIAGIMNGISSPSSQTGLLAYYNFNQGTAGGTNTGITALTDASPNGRNGTLYDVTLSGTTSNWVEGYTPPTSPAANNALHFDGNGDYVDCPAINPAQFTVEAWVYPTTLDKDQAIVSTLNVSGNVGMELHLGTDNLPIITINNNGSFIDVKGTNAISANTWTHLAATYNGADLTLYVNGAVAKSESYSSYRNGTAPVNLGKRYNETTYNFTGKIDDVRIWNAARSQSDIADAKDNQLNGTETNLLAYYNFNQGTADGTNTGITTLTDATSNGKHGTLNGFNLSGTASNWVEGVVLGIMPTSYLTATPTTLTLNAASGSNGSIAITSNTAWTISGSADWLALSATSGSGNGNITLTTLSENSATTERTASFTLAGTGITEPNTIAVAQSPIVSVIITKTDASVITSKGNTLQEAIEATSLNEIKKIEVVNGQVIASDWRWFYDNKSSLTAITHLTISNSVAAVANIPNLTEWGRSYFGSQIEEVTIHKIDGIGNYAFSACSNLTKAYLPDTRYVGDRSFLQCSKLNTNLHIPNLIFIDEAGFALCSSIEEFIFPNLEVINKSSFSTCTNLKKISLPKITRIPARTFYQCSNFTNMALGAIPPVVESMVFDYVKSPRYLSFADANGNLLTGTALENARAAYKAVDDGNTNDNFWYGWDIYRNLYSPNIDPSMVNGSLTAGNPEDELFGGYSAGATVFITANPSVGYKLTPGSLRVYKTGDESVVVPLTGNSFSMPDFEVTVSALFELHPLQVTFVAANSGDIPLSLALESGAGRIAVDKGDGVLVPYDLDPEASSFFVTSYVAGNTVMIYSDNIVLLNIQTQLLTLDVSKATTLTKLNCANNQLSFQSLPQPKTNYTEYYYAPQAQLAATCTNGIVDLSSQLTAKDANDQEQTTVYTWYKADDTALTANVDYIEKDGVFSFVKIPNATIYCTMTNAAFPAFSGENALRTVNITVDAAIEPNITFVSQKNGRLYVYAEQADGNPILIDWGNGNPVSVAGETTDEGVQYTTSDYVAGNTVKMYGSTITKLNVQGHDITGTFEYVPNEIVELNVNRAASLRYLDCINNFLTTLDVSQNAELTDLLCALNQLTLLDLSQNSNLQTIRLYGNQFDIATLPQHKPSYGIYLYESQQNIEITCTNGVVDLSLQRSANDSNGDAQSTVYNWFSISGSPLSEGTHFTRNNEVFTFTSNAPDFVYCAMTNEAFPGLTLKTKMIASGELPEPAMTFVSQKNGEIRFFAGTSDISPVLVDWGDGILMAYEQDLGFGNAYTSSYVAGNTVKIYSDALIYVELTPYASNEIISLDVSRAIHLSQFSCNDNKLSTLDVSHNTKLAYFSCSSNQLTSLDIRHNTLLETLGCDNNYLTDLDISQNGNLYLLTMMHNRLNFATLPQLKPRINQLQYSPQAKLVVSATANVVDLSAHHTRLDANNVLCTTEYAWFDMDGNPLIEGTDFTQNNGVFTLVKPALEFASCEMTNAAYPGLTISTSLIALGELPELSFTFVSDKSDGRLMFEASSGLNEYIYIDWGDGGLVRESLIATQLPDITTNSYLANSTVKVYGGNSIRSLYLGNCQLTSLNVDKLTELDILDVHNNKLSTLDLSFNTALTKLHCNDNKLSSINVSNNPSLLEILCYNNLLTAVDLNQNTLLDKFYCSGNLLNFKTLPQFSFYDYEYAPQQQFAATCTNGMVDLSSQLTAVDKDGNTQSTEYKWYTADGEQLTKGIDYVEQNGVFYFTNQPLTSVYCTLANAAFPSFTGINVFRTTNITVDAIIEPAISFVSQNNGSIRMHFRTTIPSTVLVDWGDGNLKSLVLPTSYSYALISTNEYSAGNTVKVYSNYIKAIYLNENAISTLDVSRVAELDELICESNQLTALDISNNAKLKILRYNNNQVSDIDVSNNPELMEISCIANEISSLDLSYLPKLEFLYCSDNPLGTLNLSNNPKLRMLVCENNGLNTLDLSQNSEMVILYCNNNNLDVLNFSHLTKLTDLRCSYNNLTSIQDANQISGLVYLYCSHNKLSLLEIPQCINLVGLDCAYNQIDSLNFTNNHNITHLYCEYNKLRHLDTRSFYNTSTVRCNNNNLRTLKVNKTNSSSINCAYNQLDYSELPLRVRGDSYTYAPQNKIIVTCKNGTIDQSHNNRIPYLDGGTMGTDFQLHTVDGSEYLKYIHYRIINGKIFIIKMPSSQLYLTMTNNSFKGLELESEPFTVDMNLEPEFTMVSENDNNFSFEVKSSISTYFILTWSYRLTDSEINAHETKSISLSDNEANKIMKVYFPGIYELLVPNQGLINLDLSRLTSLQHLNVEGNKLQTLAFGANTYLSQLNCSGNLLNSIDVSQQIELSHLLCSNNNLSSLNVANNEWLANLDCSGNKLSSLNVSQNAQLVNLACNDNNLSELSVGNNVALVELNCSGNRLSSLNVGSNAALTSFSCENNLLSFATLPPVSASYATYRYAPQAKYASSCFDGVVDLSSQLRATDVDGELQTTSYEWFKADGTPLSFRIDYLIIDGKTYFKSLPTDSVYCVMTNAAFPDFTGDNSFRTKNIKVDKIASFFLPIYVNASATGLNNGLSWADAYTSLQSALAVAQSGDQIWIAAGTYKTSETGDRNSSFKMKNSVEIYGGFAGTETELSQRDWQTNAVILSGDLNGDDVISGSGSTLSIQNNSENSYHVFFHNEVLNDRALLDGVFITGGNANADELNSINTNGGGMYSSSASPTLRNIVFFGNSARDNGGAICHFLGSINFENIIVKNNLAANGGGIYFDNGCTMNNLLIYGNKATERGGAIFVVTGGVYLNNSTITQNYAHLEQSSGVFNLSNNTTLNNCVLWGNEGYDLHGASNNNVSFSLNNCCYSNNNANSFGAISMNDQCFVADPQFVDAANSDFRIMGTSPCKNGGNNTFNNTSTDVRGQQRVSESIIDMGAYEWTEGIDPNAIAKKWTGAVSTDWLTAANWNDGMVPSLSCSPTIPAAAARQPRISGSALCADLTIENGAVVSIAPNATLKVVGSLDNNGGTNGLVIESNAAGTGRLINNNSNVQATVEQYIVKDQWHYITSPVVEALNVNPLFKNFYAVSHAEAQSEGNNNGNCWNYLYTGDQIVAGTGYGVQYNRKDSDNDTIVTFRGELVEPDRVITTQYSGANYGWNLVGNPYPCTIDWASVTKLQIDGAVYVYNPTTNNYSSYVDETQINGGSRFIAPLQGFFVRATAANASLQIPAVAKTNRSSVFKAAEIQRILRLALSDATGATDESVIRIHPAATETFDGKLDAYKLKANSLTPQLYSVLNGDEYSINSLPEVSEQTVVPFELMIKTSGQHTLALTELNAFNYPLVLLNASNQIVAHLESEDYIFTAEAGETVKLFLAFSTAVSVNETLQQNMFAIGMEQQIYVGRMDLVASEVMVYNINGQVVYHQRHVEANELTIPVNKQGVYMVKVQPEKGKAYIQKVLVK